MNPQLSVIIPTLGIRPELLRAIDSVRAQKAVPAVPIVVFNGDRYNPNILAAVKADPCTKLIIEPNQGVANARLIGRHHVETAFFTFLDDDDEIIPDSLAPVMTGFETDVDVIATNGFIERSGALQPAHAQFPPQNDPALALFQENWFAPAGAFCRTATVKSEYLEDLPNHLEQTYLALRLAARCVIKFMDVKTFIIRAGAEAQATQSAQYILESPAILRRMEFETSRPDIKAVLRKKRLAALHLCSDYERKLSNLRSAWRFHCASISLANDGHHLLYTGYLMRDTILHLSARIIRSFSQRKHSIGNPQP